VLRAKWRANLEQMIRDKTRQMRGDG
jgi:hypothetical protein